MGKKPTLTERAQWYAALWQGRAFNGVWMAWLHGYRAAQRDARKKAKVKR